MFSTVTREMKNYVLLYEKTREFITQTVELGNRWIRLSCYYNRV